MNRKIFASDNSLANTILMLVLGIVFFAHGAQLMLGWFGGYGLQGNMQYFTNVLHIPAISVDHMLSKATQAKSA